MIRNSFTAGLALAAVLAVPGCKRTLGPRELEQGRAAVTTGLDAWKKGDRPEALQKLNPPIQFLDEDWSKGLRLEGYEVTATYGAGGDLLPRCEVRLSLTDRGGKKVTRRVMYQVEKKDKVVVARDPYS